MAKKLAAEKSKPKSAARDDGPQEVTSRANLTGVDLGELKKGIDSLIAGREKVAGANGENSGVMKRMEKELGVSPAGVRLALGLFKMSEEKRNDVLRSFYWACAAMELDVHPAPDLVDAMEAA